MLSVSYSHTDKDVKQANGCRLQTQKKAVYRRCKLESHLHTDTTLSHETGNYQWKETEKRTKTVPWDTTILKRLKK